MYIINKFVLDNGQEFNSKKEAEKALDNLYGEAITKMAHGICECMGKYKATIEYLDSHIQQMQDIVDLYKEIKEGLKGDD